MLKSPIDRLRAPRLRRFVGLLTLVAYLIVCTGLPLPFGVGTVEAGEEGATAAYPCQGHRCGCRTAEQCWKACCCMSDLEKRMWAERNGVPLPDYLLSRSPAVAEVSTPIAPAAESARSCCKKGSGRSPVMPRNCGSCPTEAIEELPAASSPLNPSDAASPDEPTGKVEWISYLASQRCSGGATDVWLNGPTGLPVCSCVVSVCRFEVVRPLACLGDNDDEAACSFPPRRPPRIA